MWYLFGIVRTGESKDYNSTSFFIKDYENTALPVKVVYFKDVGMITKEVTEEEVDEKDKEKLLRKLRAYQGILEEITQQQLIVPVKFNTVVESLEDVRLILKNNHDCFLQALKDMEGKVEAALTVKWDLQKQLNQIADEDEDIKVMKKKKIADKEAKNLIDVGRSLKNKLEERRADVVFTVMEELGSLGDAKINHEIFEDDIILNSSFLIVKEDENNFMECLYRLDKKFNSEFSFKCICPMPPYSFRTINIQKIAPEQLEEALALFKVEENTTFENLKSKNRELMQHYHPDAAHTDSKNVEKDFARIPQSFDLLKSFFGTKEKPFVNLDKGSCFLTTIMEGNLL